MHQSDSGTDPGGGDRLGNNRDMVMSWERETFYVGTATASMQPDQTREGRSGIATTFCRKGEEDRVKPRRNAHAMRSAGEAGDEKRKSMSRKFDRPQWIIEEEEAIDAQQARRITRSLTGRRTPPLEAVIKKMQEVYAKYGREHG